MLNWNEPAKGRGRLGFSDFIDVLGFNTGGRGMERGVERSLCEKMGTGRRGEGKRTVEGGFFEGDAVEDDAAAEVGLERVALVV
jgi:hypothetical protein